MKRVPRKSEVPELFNWIAAATEIEPSLNVTVSFLLDDKPIGAVSVIPFTHDTVEDHLMKLALRNNSFLLEEKICFQLKCAEKTRKRLKHRKIPSLMIFNLKWS